MRQLTAVLGRGVVPADSHVVTADDLGLVRGDGCFDAMRVLDVDGAAAVENLDEHLARFARSAAILGIGFDEPAWRALVVEAVAAWYPVAPEAVLKVVLTRGTESSASGPTGFLTITELDLDLMDRVRTGIAIRTLDRGYASDAFAGASWLLGGAKLLSYAVHAAATRTAKAHGDDDAVFVSSDDYLLEGPTSAVLVLRDGRLTSTPPGATGILDSITLRQIFAAATDAGVPARHELIPVPELFTADGVWVVSSIRGVCPVTRLDGRPLPVDPDWNRRVTDWGGFGGLAVAAREVWRAVSLLAYDPAEAGRVRSLVAARCRAHVAGGGTVDQLAVALRVSRVAAERLLDDEWPPLH